MIPAAIFLLAFGVVGSLYGLTGLSVAKNPPQGHSAGANRARAMSQVAPVLFRSSIGSLVLGGLLLLIGLALR